MSPWVHGHGLCTHAPMNPWTHGPMDPWTHELFHVVRLHQLHSRAIRIVDVDLPLVVLSDLRRRELGAIGGGRAHTNLLPRGLDVWHDEADVVVDAQLAA